MKRTIWAIVVLGVMISAMGCRVGQRPGAAPPEVPAATGMPGEAPATLTAPMPTPTPALPGLGDPVPAGEAKISPETVQRLRPLWRAHSSMFGTIEIGPDDLIGLTLDGIEVVSPEDLRVSRFISLPQSTWFPSQLAVHWKSRTAAVYSKDPLLRLVDLTTGQMRAEVQLPAELQDMRFLDGEGERVAILADGLRIWDPSQGLTGPLGDVPQRDYQGVFNRTGHLALTVDGRGSLGLWEVPAGRAVLTLTLPFTQSKALALHPEGRYAAVAGGSQVVFLRLDLAQRKGEVVRTVDLSGVRAMDSGDSWLAILAGEGARSRVQVFRWEDATPRWDMQLSWSYWKVRLDEARGRIYLVGGRRLEARRLEDGQLLRERLDPPTFWGVAQWEEGVVALKGLGGEPDVALWDLKTGRIRWHRMLSDWSQNLWIDPKGKWLAALVGDGRLEFLDLQDGKSIGDLTLPHTQWMGPDPQGRGMIAFQKDSVLLWSPEKRSPLWLQTLPIPPQKMIGSLSSDWIAVGIEYGGDWIWLMDYEGKIQKRIHDTNLRQMYALSVSSNDVVAYLALNRDGQYVFEAWVFDIADGKLRARIELKNKFSSLDWWPDRQLGVTYGIGAGIAVARAEGQPPIALEPREDVVIERVYRIPGSAQLLASMYGARIEFEGPWSVRWMFQWRGWLKAFDVDQRKVVWERSLPYAPTWMLLDPQGYWLILGGANGYLEVWGIGAEASDY